MDTGQQRKKTILAQPTNQSPGRAGTRNKKSIWKQHQVTKRQQELSRKIKAMDSTNWQPGLTSVMAPEFLGNPAQIMMEGASQLERACLEEAGQRFVQARDMPFLKEPLRSIFR